MDLTSQVLQTIIKQKLIKHGDLVVVGVSGGADSVCLLHVLYKLRNQLGIQLHVAHLNHRLRLSSDRDEAFVSKLAQRLHLPISIERRSRASSIKLVSEDTARQWRFTFFSKIARQQKACSIALAHTQNDLAETVLMRLLRGSGLLGLRGIVGTNTIAQETYIRPLLSIQRTHIERYLKVAGLKYCKDETNEQTHYLRNKIRLKLLPDLVKNYNPKVANVLVDLAYTAQGDYDYLLTEGQKILKDGAKVSKDKIKIKLKFFCSLHLSMQRMLLRLAFEKLVSNIYQLGFSHFEEVEDLLLNRPAGSIVHWPQSVSVLKTKEDLILIHGLL